MTGTEQTPADKMKAVVEREKPLFDFTRYLLTILAWWAAIGFVSKANPTAWKPLGVLWLLLPAAAFGLFLMYRFGVALELLLAHSLENVLGTKIPPRHPLRVVLILVFVIIQVSLTMLIWLSLDAYLEVA